MAYGLLNLIIKGLFAINKRKKPKYHSKPINSNKLAKGQSQTITLPDLQQPNLILSKWHYNIGDIIQAGNVLCEIQNGKITLEFESHLEGVLTWCCEENQKLSIGAEICKIQGFED